MKMRGMGKRCELQGREVQPVAIFNVVPSFDAFSVSCYQSSLVFGDEMIFMFRWDLYGGMWTFLNTTALSSDSHF